METTGREITGVKRPRTERCLIEAIKFAIYYKQVRGTVNASKILSKLAARPLQVENFLTVHIIASLEGNSEFSCSFYCKVRFGKLASNFNNT